MPVKHISVELALPLNAIRQQRARTFLPIVADGVKAGAKLEMRSTND
jgi:hypothetical protein